MSGNTVYWTPTIDFLGQNVPFSIRTNKDFCGDRARQSWKVRVFAAPVISSFTANRTAINPGDSVTITPVFADGSGYIQGFGSVTSGVQITTPALNATTSYTLVVTNTAGHSVSQVLTINVLQPPVITSFTALSSLITVGDTVRLVWSTTGEYSSAVLDPVGAVSTSTRGYTDTPATTTNYILTLSNDAGSTATASVQVEVIPPPVINSFTASAASSTFRGSVLLTANFENGTGEVVIEELVDSRTASIYSNTPLDSGELLRNTSFLLRVTNAAGRSIGQTVVVPITGPGTFQPTQGAPLYPARYRHRAVRLLDGRVFIAGGVGVPTTELFDPVTETFTAGPNLLENRSNFGMALLNDGRVLMVGGYRDDSTRMLTAEIYDPGANSITSAGTVPATDMVLPDSVTLQDGRVLNVHTSRGQGAEIFDPSTETFSAIGPLATSHACTNINLLSDGRVLIVDGDPARQSEVYNAAAGTFTLTNSVISNRCYFSSVTLPDGRVIIAGSNVASAEAYDPVTGVFSVVASQQYPATGKGSSVILNNGKVLVTGKDYAAELFDPLANSFSLTGGMIYKRYSSGSSFYTSTLLEDGRVLVHGGCASVSCPTSELYTPP